MNRAAASNWLKLKLTSEQEFVIAGYTPGEREHFGSLALGYYEGGKLHYAGNVGTGFNARNLAELWALLEPLEDYENAVRASGQDSRKARGG